jgi:hypothetical protein
MGDDINVIAYPLSVSNVVALAFGIAPCFENRFIGALRQAGAAGDTFIGN